jgi:hypothetical protein
VFGLPGISAKSTALGQAAEAMLTGNGPASSVAQGLDELLAEIARE